MYAYFCVMANTAERIIFFNQDQGYVFFFQQNRVIMSKYSTKIHFFSIPYIFFRYGIDYALGVACFLMKFIRSVSELNSKFQLIAEMIVT